MIKCIKITFAFETKKQTIHYVSTKGFDIIDAIEFMIAHYDQSVSPEHRKEIFDQLKAFSKYLGNGMRRDEAPITSRNYAKIHLDKKT